MRKNLSPSSKSIRFKILKFGKFHGKRKFSKTSRRKLFFMLRLDEKTYNFIVILTFPYFEILDNDDPRWKKKNSPQQNFSKKMHWILTILTIWKNFFSWSFC